MHQERKRHRCRAHAADGVAGTEVPGALQRHVAVRNAAGEKEREREHRGVQRVRAAGDHSPRHAEVADLPSALPHRSALVLPTAGGVADVGQRGPPQRQRRCAGVRQRSHDQGKERGCENHFAHRFLLYGSILRYA